MFPTKLHATNLDDSTQIRKRATYFQPPSHLVLLLHQHHAQFQVWSLWHHGNLKLKTGRFQALRWLEPRDKSEVLATIKHKENHRQSKSPNKNYQEKAGSPKSWWIKDNIKDINIYTYICIMKSIKIISRSSEKPFQAKQFARSQRRGCTKCHGAISTACHAPGSSQ